MAAHAPKQKRTPFFRRFKRDQKGATAVEFAMVSIPFLGLMAGIVELGFLRGTPGPNRFGPAP